MSRKTVLHRLVNEAGEELRASVLFAADVQWQPGEIVTLAPTERYRVLERHGDPVVLVVEPAGPPTPPR